MKFLKRIFKKKEEEKTAQRYVSEISFSLELERLKGKISKNEASIVKIADMNRQILSFLGDNETKFETFKTILIRNNVCEENEFETIWDEIKGLRVKDNHEIIVDGDFARIDFEIRKKNGNTLVAKETDFPVRLGSGKLVIEDKIIGSLVRDRMKSFEYTYPTDSEEMAGETVLFNVWVNKVKTKVSDKMTERH